MTELCLIINLEEHLLSAPLTKVCHASERKDVVHASQLYAQMPLCFYSLANKLLIMLHVTEMQT